MVTLIKVYKLQLNEEYISRVLSENVKPSKIGKTFNFCTKNQPIALLHCTNFQ